MEGRVEDIDISVRSHHLSTCAEADGVFLTVSCWVKWMYGVD